MRPEPCEKREKIAVAEKSFKGTKLSDGFIWARFCQSCGMQQYVLVAYEDGLHPNTRCQGCGSGVVLWEHLQEKALTKGCDGM